MKGIIDKLIVLMKKLGYFIVEYAYICLYWKVRFFRAQLQKMKKCGIRKRMDKVFSGLGSEVYGLYKQGVGDWQSMPSVQQQMRQIEEVEADLFRVDQAIEAIEAEYEQKKAELKESYDLKRAEIGKGYPEEQ